MVTAFLQTDLDSYHGEAPTDAQKTATINWAIRSIAKRLVLVDNKISLTLVASQSDYQMDSTTPWAIGSTAVKMFKPYQAWINNAQLMGFDGFPGLYKMEELDAEHPAWRADAAGTPTRAMLVRGGQFLRVWPAPTSGVVSGGNNYVAGQYLPKDMVVVTDDSLQLPVVEDAHEAVCLLAAYRHAFPTCTESEGWQRARTFRSEYFEVVEDLRRENVGDQVYVGAQHQPMASSFLQI
jgi:hypothetical protein